MDAKAQTSELAKVPIFDPLHIDASKSPWHPFSPYSEEIMIKMLHINPVTGQIVFVLKAPGGVSLGVHHHYGTIHLLTMSGSWYYEEHQKDWVAKPGDFILEVANSTHTFHTVPGEEVMMFIVMEGSIEFLDENGDRAGFETATTFQQRYLDYCVANDIPIIDLNSMVRAS